MIHLKSAFCLLKFCLVSVYSEGELVFLWPDALPDTNQQESFTDLIFSLTTKTPKQGKGRHSRYVGSLTPVPVVPICLQ